MVSSAHRRPCPLPSVMSLQKLKLLLCLGALSQLAHAGPYPRDDLHDILGSGFLVDRSCATYCGVDNQYCCAQGQACTTNAGIAGCTDTALGGGFGIYTTTWTETDTYTSTISSYYPATTGDNGADCVPPAGSGQIACGPICCASWQYCASDGQCGGGPAPGDGATTTEAAGGAGGGVFPTTITTSGTTITTQYSAPYRVTSGSTGTGTTTSTGTMESATATGSGNGTAVTTGGDGLSGGAIAGIVIGVIAGVVILLAICACCIMRGLWHGLLAIFGLGPGQKRKSRSRDRETIIVEEERYRRGGSAAAHSRRDTHGGWFAARPPRSAAGSRRASGVSEKKKESSNAGWWGAGALGTMGLLLGLRRDKKRKEQAKRTSRPRSDVSSSYFSDSYTASSPSEFSSDYTYSSVYTRPPQSHVPVQAHRGPPTVYSASGAGRERDDYFKSNVPPDYAGSPSSGGRTRDTRRSRRTETTRISRAPSRR